MSEGKTLTPSQVFSRVLYVAFSLFVFFLFYLGNKYVCHCWSLKNSSLIGIVWPVWACTPLSLSVLSWKVPLFSLFQHPPPPCVRLEYYNVCGSRNGVSECCFPHPVRRNKTRRLEWYPALLFSDNSLTPTSSVVLRLCRTLLFLSPAHPQTQRARMVTKTWGHSGHFESHLCVHAKELLQGTDMKLDLHQIVTFHKSA